jgi:hypothetical protein
MGYYINTPDTFFAIQVNNLPRFFHLVDNLMSDKNVEENGQGGSYSPPNGEKTASWYSWVCTDAVRRAVMDRDIVAVFREWGYELVEAYAAEGIQYYRLDIRDGEAKIGDEEKFFAAIAPVVESGCYIHVVGESGDEWRWIWENGKFYEMGVLRKELVFGEPNEIVFEDANAKETF